MSDVCPVCGCKTESFDFTSFETDKSAAVSVCGYCHKQLEALKGAEIADADALTKIQPKVRWLDAALEKSVEERRAPCAAMLNELRGKFPQWLSEQAAVTQNAGAPYSHPPAAAAEAAQTPDAVSSAKFAELEARLIKTEKDLYNLKRGLLISSILEIVVPVIIFLIASIVFFKSDLWHTLQSLLSEATGGFTIF